MDSHASKAGDIHEEGQFDAESLREREEQSVPPTRYSCEATNLLLRVVFHLPVLIFAGVADERIAVIQAAQGGALSPRSRGDERVAFKQEGEHD